MMTKGPNRSSIIMVDEMGGGDDVTDDDERSGMKPKVMSWTQRYRGA